MYTESRLPDVHAKDLPLTDNPVRNIGNLMGDNPGYTAAAMALTGVGSVAALRAMAAQSALKKRNSNNNHPFNQNQSQNSQQNLTGANNNLIQNLTGEENNRR